MNDTSKNKEQLIEEIERLRKENNLLRAGLDTEQPGDFTRLDNAGRFHLMTENMNEVFWMSVPRDPQMIYVSRAYEEVWGQPRERLYERPTSFLEAIHEEDRPRVIESLEKQQQGEKTIEEYRVCRADGTVRWVRDRGVPLKDPAGRVLCVTGFAEDITERRQTEQSVLDEYRRYRTLFDLSPGGIVLEDLEGRIIDVNPAMCGALGYSREELIKEKAHILVHPDVVEQVDENIKKIIAGEQLKHVEKSVSKDGTIRYIELHEKKILLPNGEDGILCITEDITDRKKLEEEILRGQKLESLGVLAGGIAHDFNNLMTGVLGYISLAKMQLVPGEELYDWLVAAENASSRTRALTQQLLTFAKGGNPIMKTTAIADLIRDSAHFAIRGSNCRCTVEFGSDLWVADVDKGQIGQVIQNLVINAVQSMPHGGTIGIRCDNVATDSKTYLPLKTGKYLRLDIMDEGTGIPDEYLPRIFDPYFSTKQSGSGLGLATVFSIIRNHGGHVGVESELGKGTCFSVYLPASATTPAGNEQNQHTAQLQATGKVLIMDDEADVRNIAGEIIRKIGFEPTFVEDGARAIEVLKVAGSTQQSFVAALIDLTIPAGMGGKETVQQLLKIDPDIKAIASSGYAQDPIMSNYRDYGFCAVIPKPYTAGELIGVFERILKADPETDNAP